MAFRRRNEVRKYTPEEWEAEQSKFSSMSGNLGKLRSGTWQDAEDYADEMLRLSLKGVTSYAEKSDILTPWKMQMREQREVFVASGTPDPAIRLGMYRRVANTENPELNCLGADTEVLVRDQGLVRIEELEGLVVPVLTSAGWGKGEFSYTGDQMLYAVNLVRHSKEHRTILATANHRWFVPRKVGRPSTKNPDRFASNGHVELYTSELRTGQRLISKTQPKLIGQTHPSPFGVAHGVTFGDGSRKTNVRGVEGGSYVRLFGEKIQLAEWFPRPRSVGHGYYEGKTEVEHIEIPDLPGFFKDLPDRAESVPYLLGWMAGYFATDGTVNEDGNCRIGSAVKPYMDFYRDVCYRMGIKVSNVLPRQSRNPYTGEPHTMWELSMNKWSLTERFFVREDQRAKYLAGTIARKEQDLEWTVVSVELHGVAPTYCASVSETEDFVLADYILTGNSRMGVAHARTRGASRSLSAASAYNGRDETGESDYGGSEE